MDLALIQRTIRSFIDSGYIKNRPKKPAGSPGTGPIITGPILWPNLETKCILCYSYKGVYMNKQEAIIQTVLEHYPDTQAIYLFGSYAAEQEWPESDVDIAVLLPRKKRRRSVLC